MPSTNWAYTKQMSRQDKWLLSGAFLIGLGGAFAHDVLGFSKTTVVTGFVITGFLLLLTMYVAAPRMVPPKDS